MKIDELVALLDTYTAAGGYYIRPNISSDESSFFMAKGPATAADVRESFAAAGEGIGQRADKAAEAFASEARVVCAICCNVPNLSDTDGE